MKRLFLLALMVGCSYRSRDRVISPADAADPARTKLTNYLSAPLRPGQPSEQPWGQISRAVVEDEAYVTKLDDKQVCFHLIERTHEGLDMPLSDWNVKIAGATVHVDNELVAVSDYRFGGEREVVVAEAVTKEAFAKLTIAGAAEKTYRVFERTGDVCGARPPSADLVLELEVPQDDHKGSWGERFVWRVR